MQLHWQPVGPYVYAHGPSGPPSLSSKQASGEQEQPTQQENQIGLVRYCTSLRVGLSMECRRWAEQCIHLISQLLGPSSVKPSSPASQTCWEDTSWHCVAGLADTGTKRCREAASRRVGWIFTIVSSLSRPRGSRSLPSQLQARGVGGSPWWNLIAS